MQASSRAALCNLVEENLTTLIREAAVVQRHSRRARFRAKAEPADVAAGSGGAAAATGSEGGAGPKRRRLLHADDVNMALSCRGSSKLYLTNAGQLNPPTVSGTSQDGQEQGGGGGGSSKRSSSSARTAKINDAVDLNSYLRTEMTLRPPSEIGLRAHWLAVDGVQPDIPENPPPLGTEDGAEGGGLASAADPPRKDAVVHRVEDDEDLEAAAAGVAEGRVEADDGPGAGIVGSVPSAAAATAAAGEGAGGVSVRQLLPRLLSEELRLYFTRITLPVERSTSPAAVDEALSAVGRDSGIQELVPFFIRFISQQIYHNVGRVPYCRTLVRLAGRLVSNPNLHIELNLHQMLPPLITCVVARRLVVPVDEEGAGSGDGGNHWALREEAAGVLVNACAAFGDQYTTLKARVLRTLCEAVSPDMPLTTQYGGIVGISRFGPKAVDAFLLPLATSYWTRWETALDARSGSSVEDLNGRFEIQQCQRALLDGLASFMGSVRPEDQAERVDWQTMSEVFGERLIPLQAEPSEFVDCIV